mgnify:FL=1|tara:strand:+ start:4626 stop:6296 length:1671 start_codon:yes stop_codon:yes gene_type:complete
MIRFEKLRWKNFLSTGNAFTEIDFTRHPNTLVIGENGSGKSTLLDALCYSLFDRPFRAINKPQLINTINLKQMLTEIEFRVGQKRYLVRRGRQPIVFEIYCDDVLVDQDAATKDTQKYLEETILKLNYKSFTQIVILGSASFTPFMQLPTGQRREIIEDILDIQIFTIMNQVLKEQTNSLKDTIRDLDTQLEVGQQKAKIQEQYIQTLEENKKNKIDEIELKIGEMNENIQALENDKGLLSEKKSLLNDPQERHRKLQTYSEKFAEQLKKIRKELDFYENHDDCPTCKQGIPHDFKEEIKLKRTDKATELEEGKEKLEKEFAEVETLVTKFLELNEEILSVTNDIVTSERFLQRLTLEKSEAEKNVGDIDEEKSKLQTMVKEGLATGKEKSVKNEELQYQNIASSLLKDTGIKTRVIKKYLPVINQLVNKYLAAMDFFVHFDLDEKFSETIKSRHRDRFSYASFSEGEKQRIDLALLFTWRTIAKMKNSAATNLLVLDEVFDSSLDTNGTDYVMSLLQTIGDDANVFVISHKGDQLFDKFRGVIKFEKRQNYSVIA